MTALVVVSAILIAAIGFLTGFVTMDAIFGQPFLGKWWRIKK